MASFRNFPKKLLFNTFLSDGHLKTTPILKRLLNYSSLEYSIQKDPRPYFFDNEVQSLLKTLTRIDLNRVFRKRRLGERKLADRQYKLMTDEQLQEAMEKAAENANELLQIPPIVPVYDPKVKVLTIDPELRGLETHRFVFTDITFGVKDLDRSIVVRETDGTLVEADRALRNRINQIYFPVKGKHLHPPRFFEGQYFEDLLSRKEYEFLLDSACLQFEPDDPEYQRIVSIVYQHLNDNHYFEPLRSTRHFGSLTFFLVWHKTIDNLLLDLIETSHIDEAISLLKLYSKMHNVTFENREEFGEIADYICRFSNKKAALELALQAYKNAVKEKQQLEDGIKAAHGLS